MRFKNTIIECQIYPKYVIKKKRISHSIKYIYIYITDKNHEAKQYQGTRSIKRKRQKGRKRAATVTNLSWFREREEGGWKRE